MKDEIKEIIDKIKKCLIAGYDIDIISQEEMGILWNYITNLQEENKEFHKKWEGTNVIIRNNKELVMNRNTFDYLIELERNKEKAIEYIKQENKELSVDCYYKFKDLSEFDDLLNILQGSDNYGKDEF